MLDLFSRKVIGWSMSESLESKLVLDALEMARISRNPTSGLLHHSDRGVQYAAQDFQRALARLKAVPSMSRKGNCWDNAVVKRPKPVRCCFKGQEKLFWNDEMRVESRESAWKSERNSSGGVRVVGSLVQARVARKVLSYEQEP